VDPALHPVPRPARLFLYHGVLHRALEPSGAVACAKQPVRLTLSTETGGKISLATEPNCILALLRSDRIGTKNVCLAAGITLG